MMDGDKIQGEGTSKSAIETLSLLTEINNKLDQLIKQEEQKEQKDEQ